MNSRVRRKKFLFYLMTTTVDAELHFKIEPEVVVVLLQKRVSLFYNVSDGDKQIFFPFLGGKKIAIGEIYVKCNVLSIM